MKIYLDAGHNYSGFDTGSQGHGLREQDVTYYVAQKLGKLLAEIGIEIKYSRNQLNDNVGTNLATSINMRYTSANLWRADYFISLHCDSSTSSSAKGSHICVYSKGSVAEQLAIPIQENLLKLGLDGRSEQVKVRTDLSVLKHTNMPAILVEMGFISNADNAYILKNKQDELAQAIFVGICKFLKIDKIEVKTMEKHWSQDFYDYLRSQGIEIHETRFDDNITRGEVFKLLSEVYKSLKK